MATIKKLIEEMSMNMTWRGRKGGSRYAHVIDDAPKWITEVIHEVHGDKLPDDTVYDFVHRIVSHLEGYGDEDISADELREALYELEPDVYTSNLTEWLNARADHVFYLTEALEEYDIKEGSQLLMAAQSLQIQEIGNELLGLLEDMAEGE